VDAVLCAAREEFASNGYHATTVDAIARRAGVSKRTVYFWHADKAALFDACVLDGASSLSLPKLEVGDRWEEDLAQFGKAMLHALSSDYAIGMIRLPPEGIVLIELVV
jgi:TetR/AcrR family transcriptional regulator, mexJK operon transcriptional repressor